MGFELNSSRLSASEVVYKPSSVCVIIFLLCMSPCNSFAILGTDGQPLFMFQHLAPNGVYSRRMLPCSRVVSYTAFPSLPLSWRSISVALVLDFHRQAVSLRFCPVVLGLSSPPQQKPGPARSLDYLQNYYIAKTDSCQSSCLIFSIADVSILDT